MTDKALALVDALARVRDSLFAAGEALDRYVQSQAKEHCEDPDMSKINWVKATGEKGDYEKTDDVDNADYKKLREMLKEHDGKMRLQGFFLWTFQNSSTIGRKKFAS